MTNLSYFLRIGPGKVKCDAFADKSITFARCLDQALPVEDRDLLPPALDQARLLQTRNRVRDRGPLHAQHFGKQILADRHDVVVAARLRERHRGYDRRW